MFLKTDLRNVQESWQQRHKDAMRVRDVEDAIAMVLGLKSRVEKFRIDSEYATKQGAKEYWQILDALLTLANSVIETAETYSTDGYTVEGLRKLVSFADGVTAMQPQIDRVRKSLDSSMVPVESL